MDNLINIIRGDDLDAFKSLELETFEIETPNKDTLLHLSVRANSKKITKYLIQTGLSVNHVNKHKETPIFDAIRVNNFEIINLLISNDANVNHLNDIGESPFLRAVLRGDRDVVDLLLEVGADYNLSNNTYENALFYTVHNGNSEVFEVLIDHGLNVLTKDIRGNTLFHLIALKDDIKMFETVLKYTKTVFIPNNKNETPLHIAVNNNASYELIKKIVENGCLIDLVDNEQITAYQYAQLKGNDEIVNLFDYLINSVNYHGNCKEQELTNLIKNKSYRMFEEILKDGFNKDFKDLFGFKPYQYISFLNDKRLRELYKKYA